MTPTIYSAVYEHLSPTDCTSRHYELSVGVGSGEWRRIRNVRLHEDIASKILRVSMGSVNVSTSKFFEYRPDEMTFTLLGLI